MAIKSTARMSHLVLANAVGIKVGDRETRDIADIFAMTEAQFNELAYFDPKIAARDYKAMADADVRLVARNREATARYGWSPYHARSRSSRAGCIASAFRRCSCGAPPTVPVRKPTAAPIARRSRARASKRSSAPAIFRIIEQPDEFARKIFAFIEGQHDMRVYHFSEHPYPPAWDDPHGYLRVNLPNRAIDPKHRGRSVSSLLRRIPARR